MRKHRLHNHLPFQANYFSLCFPFNKSFARHLHEIQRCLCDVAAQHSSAVILVLTLSHRLNATAATGPILFHLVQGHSTMARVKVMSWRPPASCIWMAEAPSVLLQNANAQAYSFALFCFKGHPCQCLCHIHVLIADRLSMQNYTWDAS